jgi:hypothetical protein
VLLHLPIWELHFLILLRIQHDKSLTSGQKKAESSIYKETIEKQRAGCGSQLPHGISPTLAFSKTISGMSSPCN